MKIDEAIEILQFEVDNSAMHRDPDLLKATNLGKEALKRYECLREDCAFIRGEKLLGETEETEEIEP